MVCPVCSSYMLEHPNIPMGWKKCSCGFCCKGESLKRKEKALLYRACAKCGLVHFTVSREHAELEVSDFNRYFDTLSKKVQNDLYNGAGSNIKQYEFCRRCGNPNTNFEPADDKDIPVGSTINPIIPED